MDITEALFEMQDLKYKDFQCALMPTVAPETVIGVRTPLVREFARKIRSTPDADEFIKSLPHKYYEENNLHAFLLEYVTDYNQCVRLVEEFLPYVDNWATCDGFNPKVFARNLLKLIFEIERWISSGKTYTVRFGIGMLMRYYLDESYDKRYLDMVSAVKSEEYYIRMMQAWYFATALAKQYDDTEAILRTNVLEPWVHNKAIQKAIESRRISPEQKTRLRELKRIPN